MPARPPGDRGDRDDRCRKRGPLHVSARLATLRNEAVVLRLSAARGRPRRTAASRWRARVSREPVRPGRHPGGRARPQYARRPRLHDLGCRRRRRRQRRHQTARQQCTQQPNQCQSRLLLDGVAVGTAPDSHDEEVRLREGRQQGAGRRRGQSGQHRPLPALGQDRWLAEDAGGVCGTASAGVPQTLLFYCATPRPTTHRTPTQPPNQ